MQVTRAASDVSSKSASLPLGSFSKTSVATRNPFLTIAVFKASVSTTSLFLQHVLQLYHEVKVKLYIVNKH